jgi:thioredoxin domain-containing protein 10
MRFCFATWIFSLAAFVSLTGATKIHSEVVELNERFLDVMNSGFWFVKFYAPYCVHCKRLSPVWEHVGHALADKSSRIHVGKIDCTRFPSVASKLRVSAYPTIIFFRNGVQIPYEGERKKESLVEFAEKSSGPVVGKIESSTQLHEVKIINLILTSFNFSCAKPSTKVHL